MKNIYLFSLIASLISLGAWGQNRGCNNPMSNFAFQQKFRNLQRQFNETNKLQAALRVVRNNCFTSAQVKEVSLLFQTDASRITFVRAAYPKTYDRNAFHHVYDAFAQFENMAKAHEAILQLRQGGNSGGSGGSGGNAGYSGTITFPSWQYPGITNYRGKTNCGQYLNNIKFTNYARQIYQQQNTNNRYQQAWQIMTTNCMTTAQAMKLVSLIRQDNQRLELLKGASKRIYDIGNYASAKVALTNYNNQQAFNQFLKTNTGTNAGEQPSCLATDIEFNQIFSQIRKSHFRADKLRKAKTIFQIKKKCFSVAQLRKVIGELTFDQLEFAKFAYDYAHKPKDHYLLESSIRSYFDKQKFIKFLGSKNK